MTAVVGSSSSGSPNASFAQLSLNKSFSILNSVAVDESEDGSSNLAWDQLLTLCIISALWVLQQALTASSLIIENNAQFLGAKDREESVLLTLSELDGLRFGFNLYDKELSGEMAAADLPLLLQVM